MSSLIRRYHDSLFAGHLGVSRTTYRLLDRVYWPGLRGYVRAYLATCMVCLARKSPCPRRAPMGHLEVGHRWDRVAMDKILATPPELAVGSLAMATTPVTATNSSCGRPCLCTL